MNLSQIEARRTYESEAAPACLRSSSSNVPSCGFGGFGGFRVPGSLLIGNLMGMSVCQEVWL